MSKPLWAPSDEAVSASELTRFARAVSASSGLDLTVSYDDLHRWSTADPGAFWQSFWEFTGIVASQTAERAVDNLEQFPGATWFPDARLNFAENLLAEHSDKVALVSLLETGARRSVTYAELNEQTAAIATRLRALNLAPGERVAAWLPNIPETVVAMLAASSLGGVFSSCSPDFGTPGALDRFGQIEPRVLFACDGYFYAGKVVRRDRQGAGGCPGCPEHRADRVGRRSRHGDSTARW